MSTLKWNIEKSKKLYGVPEWSGGYFNINKKGNVEVTPDNNLKVDLKEIIKDLIQRRIRLPVIIRFPDIIRSQIKSMNSYFQNAIKEHDYKGKYCGVFPIKVNQQSHVIKDIVESGKEYNIGLEVGSKPELLIALALTSNNDNQLIICNGFKDKKYIEMALMFQKAGRNVFIVIERMKELSIVLQVSEKLKVDPNIGFRLKLNTESKGKWIESSGSKSKFGLTAMEIIEATELLKKHKKTNSLKLLHFHMGSQITSIQPIKSAIKEASRILCELHSIGVKIEYMDVGGGLGIDYDGSGTSDSSTNYTPQEYANDIVFHLQSTCDEKKIPHPHIITESGRFLVAYSSLLVFNVVDAHLVDKPLSSISITKKDHPFLKDLFEIYSNLKNTSINESFNDLMEKKKDLHQLFSHGVLGINQLAKAESIYWMACSKLKKMSEGSEDHEEIFHSLTSTLTDTYFCNFSVFQSLPDSWALDHIFPVMPIHRLNEAPERQAVLADLTCDSDGKIHKFMNYENWDTEKYLRVHELKNKQPYFLATFLMGAYQEILGDLHNLFGDTEAVHISIQSGGQYSIDHRVEGNNIYDVLKYVQYHRKDLMNNIHIATEEGVRDGSLTKKEAGKLIEQFEKNLVSSTYLSEL